MVMVIKGCLEVLEGPRLFSVRVSVVVCQEDLREEEEATKQRMAMKVGRK
jgi:hypothetical protein